MDGYMDMTKEKPNRLLLTMKYLWEKTDMDHPASVRDIAAHLEENGLTATRKTIYHDVAQLRAAGADIDCRNENQNLYYIDRRVFELPEVKLLVDAVQSARFISPRKSKALIKRLSAFVSEHQADVLKRQLYIDSRAKSPNDSIFYMVDALYSAIQQRQKVTFQYFEYNQKKERVLKHNGRVYVFSPYALLWNEDCYYTIGYSESHADIVKFRVDRIQNLNLTTQPGVKKPAGFKVDDYSTKVFSMYDGEECEVLLRCENSVMKHLIDRFGTDFDVAAADQNHFDAKLTVSLSDTFYGWVFSFGGKIKIAGPDKATNGFRDALNQFNDLEL